MVAWLSTVSYVVSPSFAVAYVLFPVAEAGILLAAVNWSWHAFLEPSDPENEYVQSITILDGAINVLEEDFHVVHHQVCGVVGCAVWLWRSGCACVAALIVLWSEGRQRFC